MSASQRARREASALATTARQAAASGSRRPCTIASLLACLLLAAHCMALRSKRMVTSTAWRELNCSGCQLTSRAAGASELLVLFRKGVDDSYESTNYFQRC